MEEKNYIPVITKSEIAKVFVDSVMLIEQELRKTHIYTVEDEYFPYGKIDELSKYLDKRFFKCHQSCIINMEKVVKMREQTVFFENGLKVVMGRDKFHNAKQYFAIYIKQKAPVH